MSKQTASEIVSTVNVLAEEIEQSGTVDMEGFYGAIEAEDGVILPVGAITAFSVLVNPSRGGTAHIRAATVSDNFTLGTCADRAGATDALRALIAQIYGPVYSLNLPDVPRSDYVRDVPAMAPAPIDPVIDSMQSAERFPVDYVPGTTPNYALNPVMTTPAMQAAQGLLDRLRSV